MRKGHDSWQSAAPPGQPTPPSECLTSPSAWCRRCQARSEEHTSESSHANISYAVFCLKKKKKKKKKKITNKKKQKKKNKKKKKKTKKSIRQQVKRIKSTQINTAVEAQTQIKTVTNNIAA